MADYAVRGRVQGRVQGVSYRFFIQRHAVQKGVTGWARNCDDGTVKLLLVGEQTAVNEIQEKAALGPILARVSHISWEPLEDKPLFESFTTG